MPTFPILRSFDDVAMTAAFGVTAIALPEQLDTVTPDHAKMEQLFDTVVDARREFDDSYNAIVRSDALTEAGKEQRITDLGRAALANLPTVDAATSVARQHLAEMDAATKYQPASQSFRGKKVAADSAAVALAVREREVRDWLAGVGDVRAAELLQQAVDNRDELMFGAFVNVPEAMWPLPPDVVHAAIKRWEVNGSPELASKAGMLRRAIELASQAIRSTRAHVVATARLQQDPEYVVRGGLG